MVDVSSGNLAKENVKGGDANDVEIGLDSPLLEVVIPTDFATALKKAKHEKLFDWLAYSHRKENVRAIEETKSPDARLRYIERAIQKIVISNG